LKSFLKEERKMLKRPKKMKKKLPLQLKRPKTL
jgi:hypothetical protein